MMLFYMYNADTLDKLLNSKNNAELLSHVYFLSQ